MAEREHHCLILQYVTFTQNSPLNVKKEKRKKNLDSQTSHKTTINVNI